MPRASVNRTTKPFTKLVSAGPSSRQAQKRNAYIADLETPAGPYHCNEMWCSKHTYNCVVPPNGPFVCPVPGCPYHCVQRDRMVKHRQLHALIETKKMKIHVCSICGWLAMQSNHLKNHLPVHTGERPKICPYANCDKTYKDDGALGRHMKTWHGHVPALNASPGCHGFAAQSKDQVINSRIAQAKELGQLISLKKGRRQGHTATIEQALVPLAPPLNAEPPQVTSSIPSVPYPGSAQSNSYGQAGVGYYAQAPTVASNVPDSTTGAVGQYMNEMSTAHPSHILAPRSTYDFSTPPASSPSSMPSSSSSISSSPDLLSPTQQYNNSVGVDQYTYRTFPHDRQMLQRFDAFGNSVAYTNTDYLNGVFNHALSTPSDNFFDQQQAFANAHSYEFGKLDLDPSLELPNFIAAPANTDFYPNPLPAFHLTRGTEPFQGFVQPFPSEWPY
ncbi:hypothetical protein OBBRIDRAFT_92669 [Obba rivulosa]|uniref:C2H2-type domain-containing protein n=1 Tax=Obba rivulosa TaxID=1052685 RepID=A0A8E2DHM0_9APHY|nr:hypothetical protein OBBRIDRAFT_92669 [Obba rivulosa]